MLIVETLLTGGIAAESGLKQGDYLRAYNGQALTSTALLDALSVHTFGEDINSLEVIQQGWERTISLPSGKLGIEVRPVLPREVEALYHEGYVAWQSDDAEKASRLWCTAIQQVSEPLVIAWLELRLGNRSEKKSYLQEALSAYDRACNLLEATEDDEMRYLCLTAKGRCCMSLSDLEQAESCFQLALSLVEVKRYPIWYTNSLNDMGSVAWDRGDENLAQDYFLRALEIREYLAPGSLHVASSLNNLGVVARGRSNPSSARDYHLRALEIRERLSPGSLEHAASLTNLGVVSKACGDLSSAQDYLLRSLEICERLAPGSLGVATGLNNLGVVVQNRGDLSSAQDYFLRSLEIRERLVPDSLAVACCHTNLGNVAYERGDLSSAQDYFLRSLENYERLAPGSLDVAMSLNNLGNIVWNRGDQSATEDYFLRALEIRERLAPASLDVANSLTNLGIVAKDCGDLSSAQDYHLRALEIRERLASGSLVVASSFKNLGTVALARTELPLAQDFLLRALDIYERLAPGSLYIADSHNNLGTVALARGDLSSAQDYFLRALEIRERLAPGSLDVAGSLHYLGDLYQKQRRHTEALPLHHQTLDIIENQRGQIASTQARSLLIAKHLDKYLSLLRCHLALKQLPEAFATVERCRARSLVEMLAERQMDFVQDAPADLRQQQQTIDQQSEKLYTALADLDVGENEQINRLHAQLRDLDRQQQDLTARIRQASPRYAGLQYPQPLDLTGVQAMLDPGTLALVYQTDQTQTYLFAVTKERCDLHLLPIGREQLTQKITTFRKVLDVRLLENTIKQAVLQGQELHASLLAPVQAALKRARRLLLCPEGPLLMLPFACLVTNTARTPRYLGEATPIHQAVSLTVYAQARQEKREARERKSVQQASTHFVQSSEGVAGILQAGKRLLALGDPLYPQTSDRQAAGAARSQDPEVSALRSRGMSLTPLPHTRQEVEGIGRLFGEQASLHLDAEATKTIAKEESAHAAIIHFACHAWLDHRFPLSSALVLSQPEFLGEQAVGGDNGLLQAWEVMEQMKLEADLVVLSACETGLGQEVRGEGLVGLTRAFQYAGASSVLASLWEINDASTSAFMQAFYEALVAGESKDVSVQRGIQQLRKHPEWGHPYYWGAFALQGDWEA